MSHACGHSKQKRDLLIKKRVFLFLSLSSFSLSSNKHRMEELKKSLDALLENTKELENVKLQQSNSQVVDDLIARKRSRIVRDATPYEQQIAEYCMNTEPYLEK